MAHAFGREEQEPRADVRAGIKPVVSSGAKEPDGL